MNIKIYGAGLKFMLCNAVKRLYNGEVIFHHSLDHGIYATIMGLLNGRKATGIIWTLVVVAIFPFLLEFLNMLIFKKEGEMCLNTSVFIVCQSRLFPSVLRHVSSVLPSIEHSGL